VLNKHYGIETETTKKVSFVKCNICMTNNSVENSFCSSCGHPMNQKAAEDKEQHMDMAFKIMEEMMKKPEFMEKFMRFKETRNK
jgi:hypothetical protein